MPNLVVVIVTNMEVCHDVIRVWEEAGVPGATTFKPGKCAKITSGVCECVAASWRPPPLTVRMTIGTFICPANI